MIGRNLTKAYTPEQQRTHEASVPGQAHFALTGPRGTVCRECSHWADAKQYHRKEGRLSPRRCKKFSSLMRAAAAEVTLGPAVDPATPSCVHFKQADKPPSLVVNRKPCGSTGKPKSGVS